MVKKHYALAFDYRNYLSFDRASQYDKSVSSYIAKLVQKVRMEIEAHSFNPKDTNFIIEFLVTFKLACDTDHIHEETAL